MNIGHFLTAAGEQYPERPAFISGDETTTYSQANLRTDCLAVAFQLLGLARGDRVATLMWNCPQMLESFFATWKAGGCVVPLNPRYVASEVEYQLNNSSASIIIFGEEFRQMVEQVRESVALFAVIRQFAGSFAARVNQPLHIRRPFFCYFVRYCFRCHLCKQ